MNNQKRSPEALLITVWVTNLFIFAFGLAVGIVWYQQMFAVASQGIPVEEDAVAAEVKARLMANSDTILFRALGVANEALPPISEAMYYQVRRDYPLYLQTLREQRKPYLENVEQMLVQKAEQKYRKFWQEHREILAEKYPEYASSPAVDQLIERFEKVGDRMLQRYYIDEFRQESTRTAKLWEQVEPLPSPQPDEPSIPDQLLMYASDWAVLTLSDRAQDRVLPSE